MNPKTTIHRNGDRGDRQRQPDRRAHVGIVKGREIAAETLAERLDENHRQRQQQNQAEKTNRDRDQQKPRQRRFADHRVRRREMSRAAQGRRQTSPNFLRLQAWMKLIASNIRKEMASMIAAMPVAPT